MGIGGAEMRSQGKKVLVAIGVITVATMFSFTLGGCNNSSKEIIGGADGQTKLHVQQHNTTGGSLDTEDQKGHKLTIEAAALEEAKQKGLLILVNKEHAIDENYKPEDLASLRYFAADRSEAGRYLRQEAADQFHKMVEAAAAEGHEIVVTTAYRSYAFQKTLYDNYVNNEGQEAADKFSARPGTSEHQTGLAADVSSPSVGYSLSYEYDEQPEGKWLAENAHRFGFIIRYPEDKTDITGYNYEPWHIRYVGEAVAKEIYEKQITLEEFLEEVQ